MILSIRRPRVKEKANVRRAVKPEKILFLSFLVLFLKIENDSCPVLSCFRFLSGFCLVYFPVFFEEKTGKNRIFAHFHSKNTILLTKFEKYFILFLKLQRKFENNLIKKWKFGQKQETCSQE